MTIQKFKAGDSGYTDGRQRGTVAIWHDSKLWLYPQALFPCKGMRAFIREAWGDRGQTVKILGRYPEYRVETSC